MSKLSTPRNTPRGTLIGPARPAWPADLCLDSWIRWQAYQRGLDGWTFATAEEARHPGYDRAYRLGRRHAGDPRHARGVRP